MVELGTGVALHQLVAVLLVERPADAAHAVKVVESVGDVEGRALDAAVVPGLGGVVAAAPRATGALYHLPPGSRRSG